MLSVCTSALACLRWTLAGSLRKVRGRGAIDDDRPAGDDAFSPATAAEVLPPACFLSRNNRPRSGGCAEVFGTGALMWRHYSPRGAHPDGCLVAGPSYSEHSWRGCRCCQLCDSLPPGRGLAHRQLCPRDARRKDRSEDRRDRKQGGGQGAGVGDCGTGTGALG